MMSSYQVLLLCCVLSVNLPVQGQFGNEGGDFCIGYLKKHNSYSAHILVGTTSSSPVDFTIQYSINQSSELILDNPYKVNLELILNGDTDKGVCLTSNGTDGGLIILPYLSYSSPSIGRGASYLALPYQELVTDQYEYYTLSTSSSDDQYYSGFILVGLRDNTTITIYPSIPLNITEDTQNTTSTAYITVQPDHNHTVVLHRQQTLYIGKDGGADVTGTRIVSDKPLTVISGHEAGSVPSNGTVQPMAQQIPPTQLWGDTFMIAPMMGHSQGQIIKVLSSVDYTEISYNCHQSSNNIAVDLLLKAGSVLQFYVPDNVYCFIKANNSVLVGQFPYSPAPGNTDGDTTMILVPAIDQYYNNVTFWTLNTTNNYISITVPVEDYNHSNILYDGGSLPEECHWSPIYDNSNKTVGYGCRLSVSKGHHTVSNGNGLLSVLVYGFDVGHAYGYPAALHFTPSKDSTASAVIGITECDGHFTSPNMIAWSLTIWYNGTLPPGVCYSIATYISPGNTQHVIQCPNISSPISQNLSHNGSHDTGRPVNITSKLVVNGSDTIVVDPHNSTCQKIITYNRTSTSSSTTTSVLSSMATTTISIPTPSSSPEVTSSTITTPSSSVVPVTSIPSQHDHTLGITLGTVLPILTLITVIAVIIAVCTCYRTRRKSRRVTGSFSATDPPQGENEDDEHANLITMISNPYQKYDVSNV